MFREVYELSLEPPTYRLSSWGAMDGALITVRMPLDPHPVNVYNYVE